MFDFSLLSCALGSTFFCVFPALFLFLHLARHHKQKLTCLQFWDIASVWAHDLVLKIPLHGGRLALESQSGPAFALFCLCLYKRPNLVFYLPVIRDGYSPLPGRPTWLGHLDTAGRGFLTTGNISCRFRDRDIWPVRLSLQEAVLKHPKESCISFPSLLESPWSCIVTACHLEYIYSFPELFWCVISRRAHAHTPYCEIVGLTIK